MTANATTTGGEDFLGLHHNLDAFLFMLTLVLGSVCSQISGQSLVKPLAFADFTGNRDVCPQDDCQR